ncbi:nickel pincer cofactor biosynthesis protein LarC [Haloimpatiens sp. FM7330]|uniref:nickel pincer cofactor biosynthesis protein LarC n=1 Tax=Haloimpatiens sp. FM7330 TaxID=3298610 RepID=UPI0036358E81
MKVLYYDCFSGISGDMNLGAMIDLGVDKHYLIDELSKLNINEEFKIQVSRDMRKGITGTKVDVILEHEHQQHHHQHNHVHRNLKDIENIINSSSLNENVKKISLDMFMKVAKAEAKVHGKELYEVHFHEVGAVDSIVDIVGAAICLDYLNVDKVMASSIELGGGFVKCAHGVIPVPAPATVEILKGIPVKSGIVPFETTTPTGAAIIATTVNEFTDNKTFNIEKVAYGIGGRDTEIPNVLRVFLASIENNNDETSKVYCENDTCFVLEANIDDMNPEIYDYVYERLFSKGALDVYMNSIVMKKGRPGVKLSVLCNEKNKEELKKIILSETTTLGVREHETRRTILRRDFDKIDTIYGKVTIKNAYLGDKEIKVKAEYEECKELAYKNNVSINEIYKEVSKNLNKKK